MSERDELVRSLSGLALFSDLRDADLEAIADPELERRFGEGEPTNDAMFFHMAIDAAQSEGDLEKAAWCWRMALEAGDQKARYGLGYALVELGEFREAYDNLRIYTELTPHNSWAWCWLGRACVTPVSAMSCPTS